MALTQGHAWIIVGVTIGFMALITGYLVSIIIKYRRVLQERTAELIQAGQNLKQEMEERERAQLALRESEKLAATGRIAAHIVHEINNPLAGIKNSLTLVKGAVPPDHKDFHYVGEIDNEIDRLADIVQGMYQLYKPETELPSQFEVNRCITDVVSLLQPFCQENDVEIITDLPDEPVLIHLPQRPLLRVLLNVIKNGIEASPSGERVTVRARVKNEDLVISVEDNGPGIPNKIRSKMFEPFFTTKGEFADKGIGLGLSISRSLIQAMEGSISFYANAKKGTVCTLALPFKAA